MAKPRKAEKSWANAYLTEARVPRGGQRAGTWTAGGWTPQQRNQAARERLQAEIAAREHGAAPHPPPAGGGGNTAHPQAHGGGASQPRDHERSGGGDHEDQAEREHARDLLAQAKKIDAQIKQLEAELKAIYAQAGPKNPAQPGSPGKQPPKTQPFSPRAYNQFVSQVHAQENQIRSRISDLRSQAKALRQQARALLADARKNAAPEGSHVTVTAAPEAVKAATLDGDVVHAALADIAKWEEGPDGRLYVYGRATTPEVDTDDQVVDSEFSAKALQEWLETAPTLRVQHNAARDPAGSGVRLEVNRDGDGAHWVKGVVDEPVAARLVKGGHLRAFSVGIAKPTIVRDPAGKAKGGVIKAGRIVEVSLVDSPANRSCFLEVAKAAADGTAEFTGKLTAPEAFLAKAGAAAAVKTKSKTVTVELPKDVSVAFSPKDLAKLVAHRLEAQRREAQKAAAAPPAQAPAPAQPEAVKRDFDPDVGEHGTDRDKIPDADFAGRNRSFPIVSPGDVSDALHSIGRAGPDNYSPAKLKRNILRIARRKGFPIPDADKPKKGKKAAKAEEPDTAKKKKSLVMCPHCGARQNAEHNNCSECGKPLAGAMAVGKNHSYTCLGCGKDLDKGERFCPGCGKENPGYLPEADHQIPANQKAAKAGKGRVAKSKRDNSGKPKGRVPGKGVAGQDGEKPAGPHREPDGAEVEAFEDDAGMQDGDHEKPTALEKPTLKAAKKADGKKAGKKGKKGKKGKLPPFLRDRDDDSDDDGDGDGAEKSAAPDPEMAAVLRLKSLGVPIDLGAAHDLACPAFLPAEVDACYPGLSFKTLDIAAWQEDVLEKAAGAPLADAQSAGEALQAAITLRAAHPGDIADLREAAHKMFREVNTAPSHFPTPTQIWPGQFNRPLITAGHEAASPGHEPPRQMRLPEVGGIQPEDYRRGYLAEGHADDSPANTHPEPPMPAPDRTGALTDKPSRLFYRNSAREGDEHAMRVLHDHIAARFPALCPMHPHFASTPVPTPAGVPAPPPAPAPGKKPKKAKKSAGAKKRKGAARKAGRAASAPPAPDVAAVVKGAVVEATAPLLERLAGQDEALARQRKAMRRQAKMLDALGARPDTRNAPWRGGAIAKSSAAPAGQPYAAKSAEQVAADTYARLYTEWATTTDPSAQEALARVLAPYWNPAMRAPHAPEA